MSENSRAVTWEMVESPKPFMSEFRSVANTPQWVVWYGINNCWALGVRGEPEESIDDSTRVTVPLYFGQTAEFLMRLAGTLNEALFEAQYRPDYESEGEPRD